MVQHTLEKGSNELGWKKLADVKRADLENWLAVRATTPKNPEDPNSVMHGKNHNLFVAIFSSFGKWCVRQGFMTVNPFVELPKRKIDRQHIRRALTVEELNSIIKAARLRPVQDALKGNKGRGEKMKNTTANVSEETLDRLRFLGWTRSLAYWTAAATGLRWGELRSITLGAVRLEADPPYLVLQAKDEKARRGAQIPLQADLAAELGKYIAERRSRLIGRSDKSIVEFPGTLDSVAVFDVPKKMTRTFYADCEAAGVALSDGAGRVIDVHALRHTFGTMLAKAGVSLQVAQRAMRHSNPALTANVYTHLKLLDVAGAVEQLPCIGGNSDAVASEQVANSVTPTVTPESDISCQSKVTNGNITSFAGNSDTNLKNGNLSNNGGGWQEVAKEKDGVPGGTRTPNPLVRSQVLYPLSYGYSRGLKITIGRYIVATFCDICKSWFLFRYNLVSVFRVFRG